MTPESTTIGSRAVQAEFLSPAELDAAISAAPIAYLPLGTLEFHSAHLPIGVDALNAHGLCVRAAERTGGVVLPVVYQGTGGGHSDYPWTIMMTVGDGIRMHLVETLNRLEQFGVRRAVIFTGHFADEQLALVDDIAAQWQSGSHTLRLSATGVNRCDSAPVGPDHAGVFETTLFQALWPDYVHLDRLPSAETHPARDPGGDPAGEHRHDPKHPLWGIFGPDPRSIDPGDAVILLEALVAWLAGHARDAVG